MLKTFAMGGVHPPENKFSSKEKITPISPTGVVAIPISQHLGAPSQPVVKKGDEVKVGQKIAESNGFVSTNIHSSVSGKVIKIDKNLDASGYKREAVFVQVEGDEWVESIDTSDTLIKEYNLTSQEIIEKILNAGVVGLGGATFPSHVKLSVPRGKTADYLVINGVECEPYLTSDHSLMLEKGEEILVGIQLLMKGLKVEKAIVGIENNKPDAIKHLSGLVKNYAGITIQPLKVQYPQGGEKQLIKATLNREVPSGGLPIDVGVVVFNVGSAFAVYEAIQKNKPLFERVVTVTGKSVEKPSNFKVRIGTPIQQLLDAAGGTPEDTGKIVNGGPMMGKAIADTSIPIVKGSSGILLFRREESKRKPVDPCIRCAKCTEVCPMGLEPYLLMPLAQNERFDTLEQNKVMDCMECGSCSYQCPSGRPLLDYIRLGKSNVSKILRSRKK
ncbi:MAG: electron transport complex subunit RsxC [Bacteroidales bacterium]|nr:electron transport complex subunit RsxC [Bacteroidales bacterium]